MDITQSKKKKVKNGLAYIVVLLFALLAVLMSIFRPAIEIEYLGEDFLYQKPSVIPDNIKIIAVDELTLEQLGPYSDWDRNVFADLLEILNCDTPPSVIAFDFIFSGSGDSEGDKRLAEEASKYENIVMSSKLEFGNHVEKQDGTYYKTAYVSSEIGAFDELDKVTYSGFTNSIFDKDGYTRRAYGRLVSDGKEYLSFSMRTAVMAGYTGDMPKIFEFSYSGKTGEYEAVPMSKVLDGSVPASYFADSIVLVGAYEEGMMDSYSVPIDRANNMYGVEIQANEITALLEGKINHQVPVATRCIIAVAFVLIVGWLITKLDIKKGSLVLVGSLVVYLVLCVLTFKFTRYQLSVIYVPTILLVMFFVMLVVKYIISQRERAFEMQKALFSMADSIAEAIEGRTPYNANHTKNVAKRCVEMLDYINKMHAEKRTDMHFTEADKKQLYLAAMLHDIGKMDIPLEVMDKPTRLGEKKAGLVDRLNIIRLQLKVDKLEKVKTSEFVDKQIEDIESFLSQLDSFDCGRPLKDDEIAFIDDFGSRVYEGTDGNNISYLTETELDDLHIKAGTLSDQEREMMKSHVVFTDRILSHMYFGQEFDKVRRMAADHHELLNGNGYPNNKKAEDLDVMTRILTIMDIYDSLIADDRPYKKPKSIPVAFEILDEEAEAGKVDAKLLDIAKEMYCL